MWSDAGWMLPRGADLLHDLCGVWMERVAAWKLVRLLAHVRVTQAVSFYGRICFFFLKDKGWQCTAGVAEGQPFTVDIWGGLLGYSRGCDADS